MGTICLGCPPQQITLLGIRSTCHDRVAVKMCIQTTRLYPHHVGNRSHHRLEHRRRSPSVGLANSGPEQDSHTTSRAQHGSHLERIGGDLALRCGGAVVSAMRVSTRMAILDTLLLRVRRGVGRKSSSSGWRWSRVDRRCFPGARWGFLYEYTYLRLTLRELVGAQV